MSELSSAEINHLAELARLELTVTEKTDFAKQLPGIVDFVDQLLLVKVGRNEVTAKAVPLEKMREDKPTETGLTLEEIKKMAPECQDNQVVVPAVLGDYDG